MAKLKNYIPDKYSSFGYSDWGVRRTIREAENVSRWNPWLAHAWMEEAHDQLSLDAPFFDEFDAAVERINTYWLTIAKFRWYDETSFWNIEGVYHKPQLLKKISDN